MKRPGFPDPEHADRHDRRGLAQLVMCFLIVALIFACADLYERHRRLADRVELMAIVGTIEARRLMAADEATLGALPRMLEVELPLAEPIPIAAGGSVPDHRLVLDAAAGGTTAEETYR